LPTGGELEGLRRIESGGCYDGSIYQLSHDAKSDSQIDILMGCGNADTTTVAFPPRGMGTGD
jgi:hypothetical protein